jgi:uncharacterized protein
MADNIAQPHLPQQVLIDAYGNGGFRFGDMSHRGSLLCLPSGIWAWPITDVATIDRHALAQVIAEAETIDLFLLGTGRDPWLPPAELRAVLNETGFGTDFMPTGAAVRTYNILLAERRRVAAALIAVI